MCVSDIFDPVLFFGEAAGFLLCIINNKCFFILFFHNFCAKGLAIFKKEC